MKKIIFLALMVSTSFAQYKIRTITPDYIKEDMFTIGGTLSFSHQYFEKSNDQRTTFNFSPSVSFFITSRLTAGISAMINNMIIGGSRNTDTNLGPFLRYYLSVKELAPFLGAGYQFGISSSSANNDRFRSSAIVLNGGADYFINRNVAIEAVLSYLFINEKLPDRYSQYLTNLSLNSREVLLSLGVNIFI